MAVQPSFTACVRLYATDGHNNKPECDPMRKLAECGIVCGTFDPEELSDEQLSTFLLRAALECQRLAGICRSPGASFDERVERVEALGCTDHVFFYASTCQLVRELRLYTPHARILESSWRSREAPGEHEAFVRYYIELELPEVLLPRMSHAA